MVNLESKEARVKLACLVSLELSEILVLEENLVPPVFPEKTVGQGSRANQVLKVHRAARAQ